MTTATDIAQNLLPRIAFDPALGPDSRLWIFLAERPLDSTETAEVQAALDVFTRQWTAHNQALLARGEVFQNQIIVLAVDESQADASGCSIDKSVHFLETLGAQTGVDFLEKMRFAWLDNEQWKVSSRQEFAQFLQEGRITPQTLVANTLVATISDLAHKWATPLEQSWHRRLFSLS